MTWFSEYCGFESNKWNYKFNYLPESVQKDAGNFNTHSIYDLKSILNIDENIDKNIIKNTNKKIKILIRKNNTNEELFDTSSIQQSNGNNILVQVASNFNCLELSSQHTNPFKSQFVDNMMYDKTQGPSAAGGAIAGTLQRLSINKIKPINLLENTELKNEVVNGKLFYNKNKLYNFDRLNVKIGLQSNVKANFLRIHNTYKYNNNGPIIDQIYTSTCIILNNDNTSNLLSIKLLESAYDGTYLTAIIKKSKKIILTLIGGESFRNNKYDIFKAIIKSHILYSKYLPYNCDIILPIYKYDNDVINFFKSYSFIEFINLV